MRFPFIAAALLSVAAFAAPGASPVADAAMNKDRDALRNLLKQKADVNAAQADGATALHWMVRWDDLESVDLLLKAGANAQAANRAGATPLFLASTTGNAAMIEKLLKGGADANAPILAHGETALMMASRSGNLDAVKVLLDHGAQVNAKENLRGTTAVMWAAEEGHAAVIQYLAKHGADLKQASAVIAPPQRKGLAFAPPNSPPGPAKGGLTALHFAARQGSMESIRALVEAGADVNQTSADGSSPLLVAVQNGFYPIAQFLMDQKANVNLTNSKGWSPLYLAVKNRNQELTAVPGPNTDGVLEFITLLLDRGADPNVRLKAATEVHQAMTAAWLKEAGATPLLRAALCGDLTVIRLLIDHGADPLIPTLDHTTPLMAASGVGWDGGMLREYSEEQTLEVVKLLLDKGADIKMANDRGITALHGAAYKGANKTVQLLVDRGADLAAKDKADDFGFGDSSERLTPLNWAEGVPIGMSSPIYHEETVALLTRLMTERGIPIVSTSFKSRKPAYNFGAEEIDLETSTPAKK